MHATGTCGCVGRMPSRLMWINVLGVKKNTKWTSMTISIQRRWTNASSVSFFVVIHFYPDKSSSLCKDTCEWETQNSKSKLITLLWKRYTTKMNMSLTFRMISMSDDFWISGEVSYLASAWAVRTGAIRAYVPASLVAISGELGETLSFEQFCMVGCTRQ